LVVEAHANEEGDLAALKTFPAVARGASCPPESDWSNFAAGLKENEAEGLLSHAAGCDYCGRLLRRSLAEFSDEVTDEEQATLAALPSFRRDWQQRMAARMASNTRRKSLLAWLGWKGLGHRPVLAWGYAGGAAMMAAAGVWVFTLTQQDPIEQLLATAYTDQRTLELRIPNAAYAPVRLVRGSTARSRMERPRTLLDGEARIARELQKAPDDARWLDAEGRADLLDRNFDAAIASLQHSLTLQPDSPAVMTDLASAYFERGEANGSQADYAAAADLLGRVLKSAPDDPIALFNRAILYDRMHLYDQAIADWRRYLSVDGASGWIPEARERLARVEQSKKQPPTK
jgi:tetratricopeptide (TPR) repeat protein